MAGIFIKSQIDSLGDAGIRNDVVVVSVAESRRPAVWRRLRKRVDCERYDLIHCHYGYSLLPTVQIRTVPVVASFCGTDVLGGGDTIVNRAKHRILVALTNILSLRTAACITKSREMRERLWFRPVRERCHVIPNGVDFRLFNPVSQDQARERLGLPPGRKYILFAGDYTHPRKQIGLIEAAVRQCRAQLADCELLKVRGVGQDELALYYSAADCLILASKNEGSPNVVKEALACNLPVVSTDRGDIRELLEEAGAGELASPTAESLAAALVRQLTQAQRPESRERMSHIRSDRIADRIIRIYENVRNDFLLTT